METTEKRELLTESGDVLRLYYELIPESGAFTVRIRCFRGDWEERAQTRVFDRKTAHRLLHLLAEAAVTPLTLEEILQDLAKNWEWTGLLPKTLV